MRTRLLVILMITLLGGAFWSGLEVGENKWENRVVEATKHKYLSNLHGCLFTIDSTTLRLIRNLNPETTQQNAWRVGQCDKFLEFLGRRELDEDTSRILGEARLFYDGYKQTLREIFATQIQLETLYTTMGLGDTEKMVEAQELEDRQTEQIEETKKFLERLEMLIIRAW